MFHFSLDIARYVIALHSPHSRFEIAVGDGQRQGMMPGIAFDLKSIFRQDEAQAEVLPRLERKILKWYREFDDLASGNGRVSADLLEGLGRAQPQREMIDAGGEGEGGFVMRVHCSNVQLSRRVLILVVW